MATAKQRLYRTADGRVVFEDDPDAAYLLAAEGDEIPEGYSVPKTAKQADTPEDKQADTPEDKGLTINRKAKRT